MQVTINGNLIDGTVDELRQLLNITYGPMLTDRPTFIDPDEAFDNAETIIPPPPSVPKDLVQDRYATIEEATFLTPEEAAEAAGNGHKAAPEEDEGDESESTGKRTRMDDGLIVKLIGEGHNGVPAIVKATGYNVGSLRQKLAALIKKGVLVSTGRGAYAVAANGSGE